MESKDRATEQDRGGLAAGAERPRRPIVLPYQKRWVEDRSPLKIWLASRQVGKSLALAMEAVAEALERR